MVFLESDVDECLRLARSSLRDLVVGLVVASLLSVRLHGTRHVGSGQKWMFLIGCDVR